MKKLQDFINGQIITLDSQPGISGGQYSVSLDENIITLIPSKTILSRGAMKTVLDYSRRPVRIGGAE